MRGKLPGEYWRFGGREWRPRQLAMGPLRLGRAAREAGPGPPL